MDHQNSAVAPLTRRQLREQRLSAEASNGAANSAPPSPALVAVAANVRTAPLSGATAAPPNPPAPKPLPSPPANSPVLTRSELRRRQGEHAAARPSGSGTLASSAAAQAAASAAALTSGAAAIGHNVAHFAKGHARPLAAGAAAAVLVGGSALAWGVAPEPSLNGGTAALDPLRATLEQVSRLNVQELSSRSITARAEIVPQAEVHSEEQSNVALVLHFEPPTLGEGDQLVLRRVAGAEPPATPGDGVEVPLTPSSGEGADAATGVSEVVDQGLLPDTTYSYTLFLIHDGEKAEAVAQHTASTALYPTQLAPGDSLIQGERLVSDNGAYWLEVIEGGQVVLFNSKGQKLWRINAEASSSAELLMGTDGNLSLTDSGEAVWASETDQAGAFAQVTDAGDLQLVMAGAVVWSSVDHGDQLRGADSPFAVSAQGWTQPAAGSLSSSFGQRWGRLHAGIDLLGGGRGKPFYAAADGVVKTIRYDSGGNPTMIIDHGNGVTTSYLHWDGLDNLLVVEGQKVVAGQQVGRIGNTGNSTGPHLHFEVRINDQPTDPMAYLKEKGVVFQL